MKVKILLLLFIASIVDSCVEDPFEDIISDDRQFLSFNMPGQVGPAMIKSIGDNEGTIEVFLNVSNIDLSSIVPTFDVSEYAQVSPQSGKAQDFSSNNIGYQVISESGKIRNWTIKITPYESAIDGAWNVDKILYDWHIGLNQTWGYGVFGEYDEENMTYNPEQYQPEVFSNDFGNVAFEEDNTIEFMTTTINEDGNAEGTFSYKAGSDNTFASFILNPDHTGASRDYSARFRKIHRGDGVWEFNQGTRVLILWDKNKNGAKTEGVLSVDADGSISIAYDTWINEYSFDHFEAESHIQSAISMFYYFKKG